MHVKFTRVNKIEAMYEKPRKDQGSIRSTLVPHNSVIYVNDLPDVATSTSVALFADDTKCYRSIKSMEDGACLQHNLDHIKQWYDLWHMDLNQSKCGLLSITRNASPFHYLYKLSDVQVKTMEAQKDLGVLEMELPSAGSLFEGQQDAWLYSEISFRHS